MDEQTINTCSVLLIYFSYIFNDDITDSTTEQTIYSILGKEDSIKELIPILRYYPNEISEEDIYIVCNKCPVSEKLTVFKKLYDCLLNDFLEDAVNLKYERGIKDLKETAPFLYDNLDNLYFIINYMNFSFPKNIDLNVPKISLEETINLVKDFLCDVDITGEIEKEFENYYSDGNICFWDKNSNCIHPKVLKYLDEYDQKDWMHCNFDDADFINAPVVGDLTDAFGLVHEFAHYYFKHDDGLSTILVSEFVSIVIENLFGKFLRDKGVSDSIVNYCLVFRNFNFAQVLVALSEELKLIEKVRMGEKLTKKDFIKQYDLEEVKELFIPEQYEMMLPAIIEYNENSEIDGQNRMRAILNNFNFSGKLISYLKYVIGESLAIRYVNCNLDSHNAFNTLSSLKNIFKHSDMSIHYYLSLFNGLDYFFLLSIFENDKITFPARIEAKQKVYLK